MRKNISYQISLGLVLIVTAFFVANVRLKPAEWPISLFAILAFSAPVFVGVKRWVGLRQSLVIISVLGVYALVFETLSIKYGWPYGKFVYSELLGPHLFSAVPFTVLVAWTPLVLGALAFSDSGTCSLGHSVWRTVKTVSLLVITDTVLDPAAVKLGFWHWLKQGTYYGVPAVNFFGWVLSGSIAVVAMRIYMHRKRIATPPILLGYNLLGIVGFWGLVNLFAGQLIPAAISILLISYLVYENRHINDIKMV